ncbi:MAG: M20/M25/M40 family metallo-hydrolase, partial [Bacteroidales bacterium]|nr:M20/M25/M40 family metallo-hydrolase [Bacteroidales bacterium]
MKMKQYIMDNKDRFLGELFSLLRIPSVSAKPEHKPDMERCAERLAALLAEAGADHVEVSPSDGNPVVFASKSVDPSLKTVLVYGHYDVQPPEPLEKWDSDPFEPVVRKDPGGRDAIYARGANDDKGQLFMHIKAFEYLVRSGKLRHNVIFIFEGEEETGSPSLPKWVREHKALLKSDVVLVSDTTMISEKVPSINCGMRGLAYLEVTVTGPDKDLHSGHYGGAVANPIQTLCDIISSLIDKDGRVTVPGFY